MTPSRQKLLDKLDNHYDAAMQKIDAKPSVQLYPGSGVTTDGITVTYFGPPITNADISRASLDRAYTAAISEVEHGASDAEAHKAVQGFYRKAREIVK